MLPLKLENVSRTARVISFDKCALVSRDWTGIPLVARARVQNRVVVFDNGVRLPAGQEVIVLAHGSVQPSP
jgi:hypothetical protein